MKNTREQFKDKKKLVRYLIAGSTAAITDLSLLYILTDIFGVWYLASAILAFLVAVAVSFTLQKYWTFRDSRKDVAQKQFAIYMAVAIIDLIINSAGVYLLVDKMHIYYILSQIIITGLIAISSFFIYEFVIFERHIFVSDEEQDK